MSTLQWAVTGTVSGLQNNQQGNSIAAALATASQGASAPTAASTGLSATSGLFWHDTSANLLKLRDQADTAWMAYAAVDETNKQVISHHGGCRLSFVSSTSLKLAPYGIPGIKINGVYYVIPPTGVTAAPSSTFVSGVGATALAASTAYLVHLFNNGGTLALDFWPIAGGHVTDTSAGNVGVEVRSNSGSPDSTRTLVGAVITNGSSQFQANSGAVIGVANWFNRRSFSVTGAYNASTASTSAVAISGPSLTYFQWSDEELAFMSWFGTTSLTTTNGFTTSIGFSTTAYLGVSPSQPAANVPIDSSFSGFSAGAGTEGFLNLNLIGQVGGGTGTWVGNLQAAARC